MTVRRVILTLTVIVLVAAAAACGGGGGGAGQKSGQAGGPGQPSQKGGAGITFNVTGKDIAYEQTQLTATAGQPITINFKNAGALEHSIIFDLPPTDNKDGDQGIPKDWQTAPKGILGGKSESITFTAPGPGTYRFYCHVPGHTEAGMVGQLIVK